MVPRYRISTKTNAARPASRPGKPRRGGSRARLPFHPVVFRKDELRLAFFSMITSVGSPLDVTAQELRIEAFFPADRVTEAFAAEYLARGR